MSMLFRTPKLTFYALPVCLCCLISSVEAQSNNSKALNGYSAIVVEAVAIDKNPKLAKFPAGQDTDLQKKVVADLRNKKVFAEVFDGTRQSGERESPENISASGKLLTLSTTIIDFNPGNKALRYTIGWSVGATKIKARFVFRDAATGREVLTHTQQGKFWGFITVHGTGKDYSATEASGDIVDGLIRAINKNR